MRTVRTQMREAGKWATQEHSVSDQYAFYLVDAFLRHIQLTMPDNEVRQALRKIARGGRPTGISKSWLADRPHIQKLAEKQEDSLDRWDLETMMLQIQEQGASQEEVSALSAILEWGEEIGDCDFQASRTSSFVIRIPTCGQDVCLLGVQGRKLKFFWGLFIGGYDESARPNRNSKKFPHAYELAHEYCDQLNHAFDWQLEVLREKEGAFQGFREPSKPLSEISGQVRLNRFLQILTRVAQEAVIPREDTAGR